MNALAAPSRDHDPKRPATRYEVTSLHAVACTLGSKLVFRMPINNISESGMLLEWNENEKVPFLVNTILEIDILSQDRKFSQIAGEESITHCLAKVVHCAKTSLGGLRYGLKIIQTEDSDAQNWSAVVRIVANKPEGSVIEGPALRPVIAA